MVNFLFKLGAVVSAILISYILMITLVNPFFWIPASIVVAFFFAVSSGLIPGSG